MANHQDIENVPIDIHYNKLLDWLVNRRHCQQQWQAMALAIREKINTAVLDLPAVQEITDILERTFSDINYFHCMEIVELLKETECGEKNIFGQYSSKKMKGWTDVIKLYEKDGVYLAETAQMVMRNVNYEIPALKKQITKCQQTQKDCDRKETDYATKASDLRKKYTQSCKQMGIKGVKIKSELSDLVQDLPSVYERVTASAQDLTTAVLYYQDFTTFLSNGDSHHRDCLPVLQFVQNNGNVTTYQWTTGREPVHIQEAAVVIDTKDEEDPVSLDDVEDIDWGDVDAQPKDSTETEGGGGIDFDISGITVESGGSGEGQNIDLSVEELGVEINWDDTDVVTIETVATDTTDEGVAKGEDALTMLDNPTTRNLFVDDLMELEAFLTQRINELNCESSVLSSSQFQTAPSSIQLDVVTVETMVTVVKDILSRLTSVQMQHLMLIRNSPRYVERLKESLRQTLMLADKMMFHEKETVVKRRDAISEEQELAPKVDVIVTRTKEMQKQLEEEISKKYKNRPVNIMGEINLI